MRYELEILEKIMFYDTEGITTRFPLYIYRTKEKVNREALKAAVGYAIQCHPLFGCRLAEDEKGPYLETNPEKPVIPELNPDEIYHYGDSANHNYPWIVGCRDREIIYTGYHGITDGMGATFFMRTVLYYYFKAQGIECAPGKAVTLEMATPEYLEKETECSIRMHGTEDVPSLYKPSALQPTVFPDDMLVENTEACAIHNLAISLADIKGKSGEYDVSQFAVIATYVAQAICSVLPGEDNVVMMNIIADMRGMLDSSTTHNCVMSVPVTFSQKDLVKSDELLCTMFRARLDLGFNKDEVMHSCFNSAQLEQQIGGSKEYLAGAAMQITKQYGFNVPVASVAYTHLTHTGFSDDMLRELDDVYINTSGFKVMGKQAIIALNAVTTDKLINLLMVDGTKGEQIIKALEKRLTESQVSFETTELDKYKGIIYRR